MLIIVPRTLLRTRYCMEKCLRERFQFCRNVLFVSCMDLVHSCDVSKLEVLFAAGELVDNKITWRGDSGLKDGAEAKLDLSKGMYDAGDHMKFGFPMAFTATVLSWSILEYGDQMDAVGQLDPAKDSLKWITDYLINAHPSANVLYIQVTGFITSFTPNILFVCLHLYIVNSRFH